MKRGDYALSRLTRRIRSPPRTNISAANSLPLQPLDFRTQN
jgi:hypothetical protein